MKILSLIALLTAFASPAIGAVVSSKGSLKKAHCTKNMADRALASVGYGTSMKVLSQAGAGR
jgi:hypothetical protein